MDDYGCFGFDSALLTAMSLEADRAAQEDANKDALDWDYEEEEHRRQLQEDHETEQYWENYDYDNDPAYLSHMAEAEYGEAEYDEDVHTLTGGEPEEIDPEGGWDFAKQWDEQFSR